MLRKIERLHIFKERRDSNHAVLFGLRKAERAAAAQKIREVADSKAGYGLRRAEGAAAAQKGVVLRLYVEIEGNYLSGRKISSIIICVTEVLP